jgi:hypothetical protein
MVMPRPLITAPFPCNKPIGWRYWYSGGTDGFNNTIDLWQDPVTRLVIGWESVRVMDRDGVHAVEDTDKLKLLVPSNFEWNKQDLADIPGRGSYQIVGLDDSSEGFHNWRPGVVLRLELSEG